MKNIKAVLFDLDDTLFDRSKTFSQFCDYVIESYFLEATNTSVALTVKEFMIRIDNNGYYDRNLFYHDVIERWKLNCTVQQLEEGWLEIIGKFAVAESHSLHALEHLSKSYILGIVTNGSSLMQNRKIDGLGIRRYFNTIIISDDLGIRKPETQIFIHACKTMNICPEDVAFVGDNYEIDIVGAEHAGLYPIFYNKYECREPNSHSINRLDSLVSLL